MQSVINCWYFNCAVKEKVESTRLKYKCENKNNYVKVILKLHLYESHMRNLPTEILFNP